MRLLYIVTLKDSQTTDLFLIYQPAISKLSSEQLIRIMSSTDETQTTALQMLSTPASEFMIPLLLEKCSPQELASLLVEVFNNKKPLTDSEINILDPLIAKAGVELMKVVDEKGNTLLHNPKYLNYLTPLISTMKFEGPFTPANT